LSDDVATLIDARTAAEAEAATATEKLIEVRMQCYVIIFFCLIVVLLLHAEAQAATATQKLTEVRGATVAM
jgi:hypothetical protein